MSLTWAIFDILGTIAFAVSGATVGLAKKMDIFGIAVLSVATAVGGGIIRDVLAGIVPPFSLRSPMGIVLSLITATIVSVGGRKYFRLVSGKKIMRFIYSISDSLGLAAFAVTGALTAIESYPGYKYILPVMLALITAVGGGILRDLLAQRVPVVLYADIYAVAAVLGGVVICVLRPVTGVETASWAGFFAVIFLRGCAMFFGWNLYRPGVYSKKKEKGKDRSCETKE